MPTIVGNRGLTLRDFAAGEKADGSFDHDIIDMITEENQILDDITFIEADDGTTLRSTILNGIPHGTWTTYYKGIAPNKSGKTQVRDVCGRIATRIAVDRNLYDDSPHAAETLLDETQRHIDGLREDVIDCIFYGNINKEARKFNGLYNFYDAYGAEATPSNSFAHYVANGATKATPSNGDMLRSIWLVGWGRKSVTGFYPKDAKQVGLVRGALEDSFDFDSDGLKYPTKEQEISWTLGLAVRDFRYAGRIANVERAVMAGSDATPAHYIELIEDLLARVKSGGVNQAFYMEPNVWRHLRKLFGRITRENAIKYEDVTQIKTPTLYGIPVRLCDALDTDEEVCPAVS